MADDDPGPEPAKHHHTEQEIDNPLDRLIPFTRAAVLLGVSRATVYRYVKDGLLASIRHGGKVWIECEELDEYLSRLRAEGAQRRVQRARQRRNRRSGKAA